MFFVSGVDGLLAGLTVKGLGREHVIGLPRAAGRVNFQQFDDFAHAQQRTERVWKVALSRSARLVPQAAPARTELLKFPFDGSSIERYTT